MGFLDRLKAQGSLYSPSEQINPYPSFQKRDMEVDPMTIFHEIRNRNLNDAAAMQSMPIRQDRVRSTFDPEAKPEMPVIYNPGMTEFQKVQTDLERQKIAQSERLGEGRLAISEAASRLGNERLELDQLKNKQIYETKILDMERKSNEAEARLKLAEQQLEGRRDDAASMLAFRQAREDALQARFDLEMLRKNADADERQRVNDARIDQIRKAMDDAGYSIVEDELSADGKKRTRIIRKGKEAVSGGGAKPGANTVQMIGGDGKPYTVARENVEAAKRSGMTLAGGESQVTKSTKPMPESHEDFMKRYGR